MTNQSSLNDTAAAELQAAVNAIHADDEEAQKMASAFRKAIEAVNASSKKAVAAAAALHLDDVMNPAGKARQIAALPEDLVTSTEEHLLQADLSLDVLEGRHIAAILRHSHSDDANLREEIRNYIEGISDPKDASATFVFLAASPRYATFLAGSMGESIAARYGFRPEALREAAL